jgi:hypothetical protein
MLLSPAQLGAQAIDPVTERLIDPLAPSQWQSLYHSLPHVAIATEAAQKVLTVAR